jgi:hypothetical protein
LRVIGRVAAWLFGVPLGLLILLYAALLITPIPLPFVNTQVRNMVSEAMPEGSHIELGDMALALEGYVWPVIQFKPVVYTDEASGARVTMDALEVGFSPIRALVGQPGATVTVVRPYIQVSQDMFGPRLVTLKVVPGEDGAPATVQILEGKDAFPEVGFSSEGVDVRGEIPASALQMRSDNDWLIYNLQSAEDGLSQVIEQANQGRFSRLIVKDASVDMNDAVYGYLRSFRHINIDVSPKPDGKTVDGRFDFDFGGNVMDGTLERVVQDDGQARLKMALNNLDLAAFAPVSDDPASGTGIVGASAVSVDVGFNATTHKILDGVFHIDLTGMDLRVGDKFFPIASNIMRVDWKPLEGEFRMEETQLSIAGSSGYVQGVFKLGLDDLYGPVVNVSMQGRDVSILNELGPPKEPFSRVAFSGWSAPLYGATGVDQFIAEKADGAQLAAKGRIDVLQRGMGFDMTIAGDGITADDLKRLWPPGLSDESRNWFVKHVVGGKLKTSSMHYSFPVGTLEPGPDGKEKPLPKNAINIDIVGEGVQIVPVDGMSPITVDGDTRFQMRDLNLEMSADGARIDTQSGAIAVANVGFTMQSETPGESIMELSGDLSGGIPALVALVKEQQPDLLKSDDMPIDVAALDGDLSLSLVSTIVMEDGKEEPKSLDYAINGVVQDFNSTAPLDSHTIGNGQLSFVASQNGFRVAGQAAVDGLPADIVISGKLEENAPPPEILLSATLNANDLKKLGFDAGQFLSGDVKFVAKPMRDGTIQMAVDVTDAELTVKDIGLSKAKGVAGHLQAAIKQNGDVTEISQVDIGFGDVKLEGSIAFDSKAQTLKGAEFTSIALSPGDEAQLSLTPIRGGYQVRIRGDQFDLKPMLKRFFNLEQGSGATGGPQATAFTDTTIALDVELKRALGFYKTTAFNVDLELALRGSDMQKASLSANFANESSVSVTTNATPDGKVMTVAFNDLGTLLRLMNVYPNLQGGQGTLVMETVDAEKADQGKFILKNFTIVDEDNLQALMEGGPSSRSGNLEFKSGELDFVRRKDRVEVLDAVLAGDSIGGTARGFIYTDSGQYDLSGTFVPLFGLNNAFSKLLGPLAGRDGEGLFGITFQVKGPLDKPDFRVNPMSALAPGAFRRMFEYRQKEIPRAE